MSAGESLWSKAQKEAVYSLFRYAQSHAEADYATYRAEIAVPMGDHRARLELERPDPISPSRAKVSSRARTIPTTSTG